MERLSKFKHEVKENNNLIPYQIVVAKSSIYRFYIDSDSAKLAKASSEDNERIELQLRC